MIVFTLFILICMLLAIGAALDTVRTEFARLKLQNTTDTAILAAADLDQVLSPRAIVEDYYIRAGIDPNDVTIDITQGIDSRIVSARTKLDMPTMFMDMVGIRTLAAPASGTAEESVTDLEIALALDNSGSMGQNNNARMNLLKPAAKEFVDTILSGETNGGTVSISLVPFATQVTAGAELLQHYNVSSEHSSSHCATFSSDDFNSAGLAPTKVLSRTAHFDPRQRRLPVRSRDLVCSTLASREITPWSDDATVLKAKIEAMEGRGWTSIELATKWGSALLDPSARPILNSMADKGLVNEKYRGQPFDYPVDTAEKTRLKYLVVMSDGENTNQWDIKAPYRDGPSELYGYKSNSTWHFAYYWADRPGSEKFFRLDTQTWHSTADSQDKSEQMTWPEVWNTMSVKYFTENIISKAKGGTANSYYNQIVQSFSSNTKNTRTANICAAAKAKGIIIFTIGMDTYGQGDATLSNCASSPTHFYDVRKEDIGAAFASIARTINQLRLTN